jgi:glycosidase
MGPWTKQPLIFEINTWVWLHDLSRTYQRPLTLGSAPAEEWDSIAALGMDAVWLMGVWERSPAGLEIARKNPDLRVEFRRALPDFIEEDNVGSAYWVRPFEVDARLGGSTALALAREQLAARGLRLILDFVPKHVALDHPWAVAHPEYFIGGTLDDLSGNPSSYTAVGDRILAWGRDPCFPPWEDVLQFNAFHPGLRQAATETVMAIASQCDGIRCDMAMLVMNTIFVDTWGERAGPQPASEYWVEWMQSVRRHHPDFLFMAEVY